MDSSGGGNTPEVAQEIEGTTIAAANLWQPHADFDLEGAVDFEYIAIAANCLDSGGGGSSKADPGTLEAVKLNNEVHAAAGQNKSAAARLDVSNASGSVGGEAVGERAGDRHSKTVAGKNQAADAKSADDRRRTLEPGEMIFTVPGVDSNGCDCWLGLRTKTCPRVDGAKSTDDIIAHWGLAED